MWAWGRNADGQLGDGTFNSRETPGRVQNLVGVEAISAAIDGEHTLALKGDGTVRAWGYNDEGQLGDGTTTESTTRVEVENLGGVVSIGAGSLHSLAVKQ